MFYQCVIVFIVVDVCWLSYEAIDAALCDWDDSQTDAFIVSMQECMHISDDRNQMRCLSVSGQIEIEFVDLSRFSSYRSV